MPRSSLNFYIYSTHDFLNYSINKSKKFKNILKWPLNIAYHH